MADDIDIEEHDVLNHPSIRATFPDLSLVKQEICDVDEDGFEESEVNGDTSYYRTEGHSPTSFPVNSMVNLEVLEPTFLEKSSNNSSTSGEQKVRQMHETIWGRSNGTASTARDYGNADEAVCEKYEDTDHLLVEKCFNAFVPVGGFPSDSVQAKKNFVKTKRQKALKSTAKNITTSTVTSAPTAPSSAWYTCQVCSAICFTQGDLIAHLYSHMQEHKCDFCDEKFAQKQLLEVHLWMHAKNKVSEANSLRRPKPASSLLNVKTERKSAETARAITKCLMSPDSLTSSATGSFHSPGGKYSECPECYRCFVNDKVYIAHVRRHHGQVVHTVPNLVRVKSIPNKCPICQKPMQKNMQKYNDHIRQSHSVWKCDKCGESFKNEYLRTVHYKRCRPKRPETPKSESDLKENVNLEVKFFYKCRICEMSFPTYKKGYKHKVKHHKQEKNVIVRNTQKLILRKKNQGRGNALESTSAAGGTPAEVQQIADSSASNVKCVTLYHCRTCKGHMSKKGRASHKEPDCVAAAYGTCHICGLSFVNRSIETHLIHHQQNKIPLHAHDFIIKTLSGDDMKLDLHSVIGRLPKCDRCGLTFNRFADLCRDKCQDLASKECNICNATFDTRTYDWHLPLHKLDHGSSSVKSSSLEGSDALEVDGTATSDTQITKSDLTLVRCDKCKTHVHNNNFGIKIHKDVKNCEKFPILVCTDCGLTFTKNILHQHRELHNRSEVTLTMSSFRILRMKDLQPVGRELCRFAECRKCKLHHEGGLCWLSHINYIRCRDDPQPRIKCETCDMIFTATSYKLHLPYYGCSELESASSEDSHKDANISMLLEKYNEMPEQWCQLYKCKECSLVVDSYEAVQIHCEEHLRPTEEDYSKRYCLTCDLTFESASYAKHIEYHLSEPKLGRSDFEIIEYNPLHYQNRSWSKHYFTNTKFKVLLKQNGRKEFTLYQCNNCEVFFPTRFNAYHHSLHKLNCEGSRVSQCADCKLRFGKKFIRIHSECHRSNPGLDSASFRILTFINTSTVGEIKKLNKELKSEPEEVSTEEEPNSLPKLYRCVRCKLNFMHSSAAMSHRRYCGRILHSYGRKQCNECQLSFTASTLQKHVRAHHGTKQYARGDFIIHSVNPTNNTIVRKNRIIVGMKKPQKRVVKMETKLVLYQCVVCMLHFTTKGGVLKHIMRHKNPIPKAFERCGACGLEFSKNSLESHRRLHHQNNDVGAGDFSIVPINYSKVQHRTSRLFRCSTCDCHFVGHKVVRTHKCSSRKRKIVTCDQCGLNFSSKNIMSHQQFHHQLQRLTLKDFHFVEIGTNAPKVLKTPTVIAPPPADKPRNTIYKCLVCNVHYLKKKSLFRHRKVCPKVMKVNCDDCGLTFSSYSVKVHQHLHHKKTKLALGDFDVVVVKPDSETSDVYKCARCDVHYVKAKSVYYHLNNHDKPINTKNCNVCGLQFPLVSLHKHKDLHHRSSNSSFNVVCIGKRSKYASKGRKVEKKKHPKTKVIQKIKAEKTQDKQMPPQRIKKKIKVYKCRKCGVHYFDKSTLCKHLVDHVAAPRVVDCDVCGLLLTTYNFKMHKNAHHRRAQMTLNDFVIIELDDTDDSNLDVDSELDDVAELKAADNSTMDVESETDDVIELKRADDYKMDIDEVDSNKLNVDGTVKRPKSDSKVVLYKCKKCNLHFVKKQTFVRHKYDHWNGQKLPSCTIFECKFCKCTFTKRSLKVHEAIHHGENKRFLFVIEEFDPKFDAKRNYRDNPTNGLDDTANSDRVVSVEEPDQTEKCAEIDDRRHVDVSTQPLGDDVTQADTDELFHEMADAVLEGSNEKENTEDNANVTVFKCAMCSEVFGSQIARKVHVGLEHIS